jgi:uncharacterized cupin superfamily protein
MVQPRFVRVRDAGSAGLEAWPPLEPQHVADGTPQQRGLMVHEDVASGLSVGLWECTAWTGTMGPWSTHEFMIVLEGEVTVEEASGTSTTVRAGESFVIPKGLICSWKQTGTLRKIFMIFDDASGAPPPATQTALRLDPSAPLQPAGGPDPKLLVGPAPEIGEHIAHRDPTGRWAVGIWGATPYERQTIPFPRAELMHILEGTVELPRGDGTFETVGPGDTVFIPHGAPIGWKNRGPARKIFCSLLP